MRADPVSLILDKKLYNDKLFYLISGNEITLIEKIKSLLIKRISSEGLWTVEEIKNIELINNEVSLFGKDKVF